MNDIQDDYKEKIASSLENMVRCFEKMNLTTDQIVNQINDMPSIFRSCLRIIALLTGNKELAKKISDANETIKMRKIDEFKNAVTNGTHEEFLSDMSLGDKGVLSVGIKKLGEGKDLTEEEQKCSDIIKKSMDRDIEKMGLNQDIGIAHHVQGRDIVKKSMDKDMEKMGLNQDICIAHHVQGRDDFSIKTGSQYILRKIKK